MQIKKLLSLTAVLLTLCGAAPASGGLVTLEFAGEVTSVQDDGGILGGGVEAGDSFSAAFTFESDTPDDAPDNPMIGMYRDVVNDITGNAGDLDFAGPAGFVNGVRVVNDLLDLDTDLYIADVDVHLAETPVRLMISLRDGTGTVFNDDSLPVALPGIDSFEHREFELYNLYGTLSILGACPSNTVFVTRTTF